MLDKQTEAHMNDPQVGDRFHEMYSFWVEVLERDFDCVTIREDRGDNSHPERTFFTLEQFQQAYAYKTPGLGYWITYYPETSDA